MAGILFFFSFRFFFLFLAQLTLCLHLANNRTKARHEQLAFIDNGLSRCTAILSASRSPDPRPVGRWCNLAGINTRCPPQIPLP